MKKLFLSLVIIFSKWTYANIVLVNDQWRQFVQPDGAVIEYRLNGDSNNHWYEDINGLVIQQVGNRFVFELKDSDELISAHKDAPINVLKSSEKWASFVPSSTDVSSSKVFEQSSGLARKKIGRFQWHSVAPKQPLLIVAVSFNDSSMVFSSADHLKKFFGPNSVSEFYSKASYGKYTIEPARETYGRHNDGYAAVKLNIPQPKRFRSGLENYNIHKIYRAIVDQLHHFIDFKSYDKNNDGIIRPKELAITFIVSGMDLVYQPDADKGTGAHWFSVCAEKKPSDSLEVCEYSAFGELTDTNRLFNTYMLSHELGHHILRLPDLYFSGNDTSLTGFDVMGAAFTEEPIDFSSWSKDQVGFIKPKIHNSETTPISLKASHENSDAYKIWIDEYRHREYLLLEFKEKSGINKDISASGLVITHVIENHERLNIINHLRSNVIAILDDGIPFGTRTTHASEIKNSKGEKTNFVIDDIVIQSNKRLTATVRAKVTDRASLGYNEAPHLRNFSTHPSDSYETNGKNAFIMEVDNTAIYAEGIDIAKNFDDKDKQFIAKVKIAKSIDDIKKANFIYEQDCHIANNYWNRCMFDRSINIKTVTLLYVYLFLEKREYYVLDPGPKSGRFYNHQFEHSDEIKPWDGRDLSLRLLVSGLAPNQPPVVTRKNVELPVGHQVVIDKSLFGAYDPDGRDAELYLHHMSFDTSEINTYKLGEQLFLSVPDSFVGKTLKASVQFNDELDVTEEEVQVRFLKAQASSGNQPSLVQDNEASEGTTGSLTYWILGIILFFKRRQFPRYNAKY